MRKIIRNRGCLPRKESLTETRFFDQQRETTAVFSMELRIRSDPWEILRLGRVEEVRKWHMGCGEGEYCGICFDKAGAPKSSLTPRILDDDPAQLEMLS